MVINTWFGPPTEKSWLRPYNRWYDHPFVGMTIRSVGMHMMRCELSIENIHKLLNRSSRSGALDRRDFKGIKWGLYPNGSLVGGFIGGGIYPDRSKTRYFTLTDQNAQNIFLMKIPLSLATTNHQIKPLTPILQPNPIEAIIFAINRSHHDPLGHPMPMIHGLPTLTREEREWQSCKEWIKKSA